MRAQAIAAVVKPLRLNFAQVCIQCGDRWCESPDCVARHERSRWVVCRECEGFMETPAGLRCDSCLFGLEETWPAGVKASLPTATVPDGPRTASARVAPCVPGAPGSLAYDPEYAEYLAYKRGQRS